MKTCNLFNPLTPVLSPDRGEGVQQPHPGFLSRLGRAGVRNQVRTILSPTRRVTRAFFQSSSLPACLVRWRRSLPRTLRVFTRTTLTLKSSSTALRIWNLLARRSATTVYWLSFEDCRVPFSVRRAVL